jgi:spore germination protein
MIIYEVQEGDTITLIANKFGVSEARLVNENGITNPTDLVIGQTIVITNPKETYIVKAGDTIPGIALNHGISIMQLFQNNPYLWDRKYIYPGEELIIRYDTRGTISTSAYVFPFINIDILKKTLPYLTYLSIQNYKTLKKGEIESFYDDSELIQTAKQYGVIPIMLVSSITFQGVRDPEMVYEILLNPDYQYTHANSMLKVLKEKGYYGVNITITFLNKTNQELYLNYLKRVTAILHKEGYLVFITIDPNFLVEENQTIFEKVDYSNYNELIDEAYLMRFYWGTLYGPPMPVTSINNISLYLDYVIQMMAPKSINIGFPLLGYDWTQPYIEGFSKANAITLDSVIELARTTKSKILFDDVSETPYFEYSNTEGERSVKHIVWFVDARTIYAIINLVLANKLQGSGLWNIMSYNSQLWLIINSNCEIKKLI